MTDRPTNKIFGSGNLHEKISAIGIYQPVRSSKEGGERMGQSVNGGIVILASLKQHIISVLCINLPHYPRILNPFNQHQFIKIFSVESISSKCCLLNLINQIKVLEQLFIKRKYILTYMSIFTLSKLSKLLSVRVDQHFEECGRAIHLAV